MDSLPNYLSYGAPLARKELRYKTRVRDGFSEIPLNTETLVFPLGANTKF